MDRAGAVRQLSENCREQEKMERVGCNVVSGAPTIRMGYGKVKKKKKHIAKQKTRWSIHIPVRKIKVV